MGGISLLAKVNEKIVRDEEASISVFDRGLVYGDGAFEAIRLYEANIFRLKSHLARLKSSLEYLGIDVDIKSIQDSVLELVRLNKVKNAYIRIIITRGQGPYGVNPSNSKGPTIIITMVDRPPLFLKTPTASACFVPFVQNIPSALDPSKKTLNYINKVLSSRYAISKGYDFPIISNLQGFITESGSENIFIIDGSKIRTPPVSDGLLEGITRDTVLVILKKLKKDVMISHIRKEDLINSDSILLTGTSAGIIRINRIEDKILPEVSTKLVEEIISNYLDSLRGNNDLFNNDSFKVDSY
ncbi:MAG: aminotransferase class IV [Conexivisphaerales archaeon]